MAETLTDPAGEAVMMTKASGDLRNYELFTTAELRDHQPPEKKISFTELPDHARMRSGNVMFDGLYALAENEAQQLSVSQIRDWAYDHNDPLPLEAFQTGVVWTYVWTRDMAYSAHLALAGFDPSRAANSLLFKSSVRKPSLAGGAAQQIIQDTGSGGSWPVSSDRIVWILGADATSKFLPDGEREQFLARIYPILRDTLEQDRKVIFDPTDGLYRGEQSFLDWREQTYPLWTKDNVGAIAMSKALSVNAADYFALRTASEYAARLGFREEKKRYARWAVELKKAINRNFYDADAGLYSTCLFTDNGKTIRTHRYDLLGESLAILLGVANTDQAKSILQRYPAGPYGPPVVWPEERGVPVYHNHAIWPFVTAYWLKAGRLAGDAAVVDAGVHSLMRGAALNLSNMENFDFGTGKARVENGVLSGPVVNSRRQLWSVAGYLAMVQDGVFGLETSFDGIRFVPCVTTSLRNEIFPGNATVELQNFGFRGKTINLRLHLPPVGHSFPGIFAIGNIRLNGKDIGQGFVPVAKLAAKNEWEIFLEAPSGRSPRLKLDTLSAETLAGEIFAPAPPTWAEPAITAENGHLTLHFREGPGNGCSLNLYRDGRLCASRTKATDWTDPRSADYADRVHFYMAEAVDEQNGNASHLTPSRSFTTTDNSQAISASQMENHGGHLAEGQYFTNWGTATDALLVKSFTVAHTGHYLLRAEFANGTGPVNTGITCAVKRIEVRDADSGQLVSGGYWVMPQSGDWKRWDWSSTMPADLAAGTKYSLRFFEDECSRNMSYLAQNRRYTAGSGGGDTPCNLVNIASIRLQRVAE